MAWTRCEVKGLNRCRAALAANVPASSSTWDRQQRPKALLRITTSMDYLRMPNALKQSLRGSNVNEISRSPAKSATILCP